MKPLEAFDRLPPHDINSEAALLASCMLDSDVFAEVRAVVRVADFYQPDHGIIYDALCGLAADGTPVDAVILANRLKSLGKLSEVGGIPYLSRILSSVPDASHGAHYAAAVRETSGRRQVIQAANDALRRSYSAGAASETAATIASDTASRLSDIGASSAVNGFESIGEVASRVLDDLTKGKLFRLPSGLRSLDEQIGGFPVGGFAMVAARPGMGKSEFLKTVARLMAQPRQAETGEMLSGHRIAVITVEESAEKVAGNVLSTVSGVGNKRIANAALMAGDMDKLCIAFRDLSALPIYINDKPVTIAQVESAITLARVKHGCEVVLVDYLQLIGDETDSDNENFKVTQVSKRLKSAFKRARVAGIAAVQLNRGNEVGTVPPPPTLRHLRGSGSLEQDGDLILALHSEDYYRKSEPGYAPSHRLQVHILKNKDGPSGMVPLYQNHATLLIRDRTDSEAASDTVDTGGF